MDMAVDCFGMKDDPSDLPAYSVPDAARYLRMNPDTPGRSPRVVGDSDCPPRVFRPRARCA